MTTVSNTTRLSQLKAYSKACQTWLLDVFMLHGGATYMLNYDGEWYYRIHYLYVANFYLYAFV